MARNCLKYFGIYSLWRTWLIALTLISVKILPFQQRFSAYMFEALRPVPSWAWPWANMDGVVFMLIAKNGYETVQLPFFPLFPFIIRVLQQLTGLPYIFAGLFASLLLSWGAFFFLKRLLQLEKQSKLLLLIVTLYLVYPTGHYLSAVYNDSLFVMLSLATFFFGRQHQYAKASVVGFLATLARLNGLALFAFLGMEYFIQVSSQIGLDPYFSKFSRKYWQLFLPKNWWRTGIYWALLIPGAFAAYLAWIQWQFGDWSLFFSNAAVWHRSHLTFPLQTVWRYGRMMMTVPMDTLVYWVACSELFFALFYVIWLIWSWKRIRFSYWVFWAVSWIIPSVTGTFQGMPRYGLHMFPLFFAIALWLTGKPRWVTWLWMGISLLLQAIFVMYYTRGYFVA